MKVFHAPLTTRDRTSDVWDRWQKSVGESLVQSCTSNNYKDNDKIKWVINGINCTVVYHDPDGLDKTTQTFSLPYTALMAFQVGTVTYPAGTSTVEVPAEAKFLQFQYIINLNNKIGA